MVKIEAEIFSRVSGYYRPVAQWNKGKREEYKERKVLNIQEFVNDNKKTADVP